MLYHVCSYSSMPAMLSCPLPYTFIHERTAQAYALCIERRQSILYHKKWHAVLIHIFHELHRGLKPPSSGVYFTTPKHYSVALRFRSMLCLAYKARSSSQNSHKTIIAPTASFRIPLKRLHLSCHYFSLLSIPLLPTPPGQQARPRLHHAPK